MPHHHHWDKSYYYSTKGSYHYSDTKQPSKMLSNGKHASAESQTNVSDAANRSGSNCSTYPSEFSESSIDEGKVWAEGRPDKNATSVGIMPNLSKSEIAQSEKVSLQTISDRLERLEAAVIRIQETIEDKIGHRNSKASNPMLSIGYPSDMSRLESEVLEAVKDTVEAGTIDVIEELQEFTYKLAQNQIDLIGDMLQQTLLQSLAMASASPFMGPSVDNSSLQKLNHNTKVHQPTTTTTTTSSSSSWKSVNATVSHGRAPVSLPQSMETATNLPHRTLPRLPCELTQAREDTSSARRLVGIINATSMKSALFNNNHIAVVANTSNTNTIGRSTVTWQYNDEERSRCGGLPCSRIRDFFNMGIPNCASIESSNIVIDCDVLAEAGVRYSCQIFQIVSLLEDFISAERAGKAFNMCQHWQRVLSDSAAGITEAKPLSIRPSRS